MTLSKKEAMRTCILTKQRLEVQKLHKITKHNNQLVLNNDNSIQGRSVYITKDKEEIKKAMEASNIKFRAKCLFDKATVIELVKELIKDESI